MKTVSKIEVKISLAWWFRLYAFAVAIGSTVTGMEPDWEKVSAMAKRAAKTEIV